jgi:hypothetical protein
MDVTCRVCKKKSEQIILTSTNSFGSPDLDLRPPEMQRSTMCFWVQRCPSCGYVASSINDSTNATRDYLNSDDYKNAKGRNFKSDLAKKFYQHYLVSLLDGETQDAFNAALHAAWACDDSQDGENAVYCRNLAINKLARLMEIKRNNENLTILKCDLLRRAGRFEELISEYSEKKMKDKLLNKLLAFQLERARAEDTSRYTVEDATREGDDGDDDE